MSTALYAPMQPVTPRATLIVRGLIVTGLIVTGFVVTVSILPETGEDVLNPLFNSVWTMPFGSRYGDKRGGSSLQIIIDYYIIELVVARHLFSSITKSGSDYILMIKTAAIQPLR